MSHEAKIHTAQTSILRELLFLPQASYSQLQKSTDLTSDHFNFHVKRLVELGYVDKLKAGMYALTTTGKEYANRLDTDNNTIERQPKSAVILAVEADGKWLLQERLKQPYFGFYGFPSGKIRWGETIVEAAARELDEETGLTADLRLAGVYHEIVKSHETGEVLEDKIFYVVHCTNYSGKFLKEFEGGRNEWLTELDLLAKEKRYDSAQIELNIAKKDYAGPAFTERTTSYTKEQF